MQKQLGACSIVAFLLLAAGAVQAQPDLPRFEVGIHYTTVHFRPLQEWPGGFGGRFGYNVLDWLAVEGEFNYLSVRKPGCVSGESVQFAANGPEAPAPGSSNFLTCEATQMSSFGESQALLGVKGGIRIDRFGLFGKIKPGFVHFTGRQNLQLLNKQGRLRFALEAGGTLEYYLSPVVALRFDAGRTWIDFGGYRDSGLKTRNWNFQAGGGPTFRF